jgi:hypothetical protein
MLSFYVQIIYMFFINHELKFKYPPRHIKVKFVDATILFQRQKLNNRVAMFTPWYSHSQLIACLTNVYAT